MAPIHYNFLFVTTMGVFAGISVWLMLLINRYVPWPYMDEVFHIPQAQKYCQGNFTQWDPKLTTPPGLYFLSIGAIVPLASFFKINACSVLGLRITNVFFAVFNLYLAHKLVCKIHPPAKDITNTNRILMSLSISLLPTLYFFTFLYYTDAGSTAVTLLSYLLHLHGSHKMSAAVGCLSVFFRQTNIVWVAFFGVSCLWDTISRLSTTKDREGFRDKKITPNNEIREVTLNLVRIFQQQRPRFWDISWFTLTFCFPYILVGFGFVVFVFLNGGIALGDKKAHEAGLHLAQAMYFLAFAAFGMVMHVSPRSIILRCKDTILNRRVQMLLIVAVVLVSIHWGTYGHPYVLADNRHFTFYLWRKVINRTWYMRYLLAPGYVASLFVMSELTDHTTGIFWKLTFWVCAFVVLVPQRLIELRYFTVPYIVLRLQVPPRSSLRLLFEFVVMVLVNFVTVYVFLQWPFTWKDEHTLQRFMW